MLVCQRIQQSGLAVGEQSVSQIKGIGVGLILRGGLIDQCLHADNRHGQLDFVALTCLDVRHGTIAALGHRTRLHTTESLFQQGRQRVIDRDVAAEDESHVRRHIVLLVERCHVRQPRILQILRRAEDGIGVRLFLEDGSHDSVHGIAHAVGRTVLLLVDVLQLALETTEHGVHQSLGVQPAPLLDELWQEGVVVVGHIVARTGIQSAAAILRDEAVELVGNHVVGSLQTQLVDVHLDVCTLSVVFGLA